MMACRHALTFFLMSNREGFVYSRPWLMKLQDYHPESALIAYSKPVKNLSACVSCPALFEGKPLRRGKGSGRGDCRGSRTDTDK